jgi:membrane-associated phospholipid phosphatase
MPALLLVALLSASPHALKFDAKEDLAVTGAALAVWGGGALLKGTLGPDTCRWCDRNADGTDALNGFDRWGTDHLIWSHPVTAANLSNVAIITLPVAVAGLDFWMASSEDAPRDTLEDLVMIAEATAINGALNEGVKNLAARQRPYAHLAGATGPGDVEDNVSFYSGHSSTAFSLATAAGTIASLRGYEHAWAVWAVGMPLATGIAYLRVGGAKHYLTDVLTGALVGGAIGAGVPLLFHARLGEVHAQLVSGPGSVSLVGVW